MPRDLHPRAFSVQAARNELAAFITDWAKRHQPTQSELLFILTEITQRWAAAFVRAERDEDAPGT